MENEQKNIKNELKTLNSKKLSELYAIQNSIPDNYFQNLNGEVLQKIKDNEKKIKKFSIRTFIAPFSIAATILLLIGLFFFTNNEKDEWADLSNKEIETYLTENIEDFSDEEIASLVLLDKIEFEITLSNEAILDYLMESDFSEEELF